MSCCCGGKKSYIVSYTCYKPITDLHLQFLDNPNTQSLQRSDTLTPDTISLLPLSRQCPFCAIKLQSKQVLVATDQCFIIKDKHPKAFIHLLVIPRQHVQGLDDHLLTLQLLEDMYSLALVTVERMYPAGAYKIGFRPTDSNKHLHLHAFVPPHRPWWRRWRYKGERWVPVETVLEELKARQQGINSNRGGNGGEDV